MCKKLAGWVQEHPYSYWLVYMIFYLTGFFLVEQFVEAKYWISCPIDGQIPYDV